MVIIPVQYATETHELNFCGLVGAWKLLRKIVKSLELTRESILRSVTHQVNCFGEIHLREGPQAIETQGCERSAMQHGAVYGSR